ncbi:MAG: winged helix-turn-helix domain-containing protein [Methanolobus sp.]
MSSDIINEEQNGIYLREFESIRSEILSLKKDINRALERSDNRHTDALLMEIKGDISRPVLQYMLEDTKNTFDEGFCEECEQHNVCKPAFSNLLQEMALLLLEDRISETILEDFRKRFEELKSYASTENCDGCVKTASRIFEKQMELISSLNKSSGENNIFESGPDISELSDDIVTDVCEPLANKQRLSILKSLNSGTASFSELSRLTGLRGGNLLFHIQKLLDTGMIIQRNERGDYMITKKGHVTLKGMAELHKKLRTNNF